MQGGGFLGKTKLLPKCCSICGHIYSFTSFAWAISLAEKSEKAIAVRILCIFRV